MVVTGVRSSCAASAMKSVLIWSARSSATRASRSRENNRARARARPVSAASVVIRLSSSSPKNGAYGLVHTSSEPDCISNSIGWLSTPSAQRCSATTTPLSSRTATARAPTMSAIGARTRRATSSAPLANETSSTIACWRRACSGRRHAGEHLHPPPRSGRLMLACGPEPGRGDDRQDRPVDEEGSEVDPPPGRSRIAGRGQAPRQGERPEHHERGHRRHELLEAPRRRAERAREAVEQIREEDENREHDPLEQMLAKRVRAFGKRPGQENDGPECAEAQRSPLGGEVAAGKPLPRGHDAQRRERKQIQDRENLDERVHTYVSAEGMPAFGAYLATSEHAELVLGMPDALLELPAVGTRLAPLHSLELGPGLVELAPGALLVDLARVHGVVDERDRSILLHFEEARTCCELLHVLIDSDVHTRRAGLEGRDQRRVPGEHADLA